MMIPITSHEGARRPNFFVVGVAKAGTSSLYHYLSQHPEVYLSPIKEPFYFSNDIRSEDFYPEYRRRVTFDLNAYLKARPLPRKHIAHIGDQSRYLELFREVNGEKAIGEMSTGYLYSSCAAENIFKFNPDARIVMILRQPAYRAYSHYQMNIRDLLDFDYDFISALQSDFACKDKGWGKSHLYVETGLYAEQVRRYLDVFPERQVKIFLFEDLVTKSGAIMEEIFAFLEIDVTQSRRIDFSERKNPASLPKFRISRNSARVFNMFRGVIGRTMPGDIKELLRRAMFSSENVRQLQRHEFEHAMGYFKEDIEDLSGLIKRDLRSWLQFTR